MNSAVMPYEGAFIGVFRGEQTNGIPYIYLGRSEDAIHWNFDSNKIPFHVQPFMIAKQEGLLYITELLTAMLRLLLQDLMTLLTI